MFKKLLLLFSLGILLSFSAEATHLVGGSMSYQNLGTTPSGNVRYKVTLTLYRDCSSTGGPNGTPVEFDDEISICVFDNTGSQPLRFSSVFSKTSEKKVDPLGRTDCPETKNACLRQGVYEKIIDLPRSNFGYILFWERCCRNDITNLANGLNGTPNLGQSYQAIIPPTNTTNSSPYFKGVPVPFICVNDTIEISNLAFDPDNDELSYAMTTPWSGAEDDPVPGCKASYLQPKTVVYNAGYNTANPYGASGIAKINSTNGLTTFLAKSVGSYAVAIEVTEKRNGVVLSVVRLELQILVINCPPNAKPVIAGGDNQQYTIDAGELLCFNVNSTDADNHNIQLTGTGDVLDGANEFPGQKATFSNKTGKAFVSSQFCWQTECLHARDEPYIVSFRAVDDGCPSKYKIVNVSIYVKPFNSDIGISGPNPVCENANNVIYSAANRAPGSVINWRVSPNGTIVSGGTGATVGINWNGGSSGYVYIEENSIKGCPGSKDSLLVTLIPTPPAPNLTGKDDVCQNSNEIYTFSNLSAGNTIAWGISNGSILSGQGTVSVNVNWGAKGLGKIFATQTNSLGCVSDSGIKIVTIHKPNPPVIDGVRSICPYIQNVPYYVVNSQPNYRYNWSVQPTGIIAKGQGTDSVRINWGPLSTNYVSAMAFDQFGCPSDRDSIQVQIEYILDGEKPLEANSVCELSEHEYYVRATPKSVYRWTVSGGNIIAGDSGAKIMVRWGLQGVGQVSVIEESYDTVNMKPCISLPNIFDVVIHPNPIADKIEGIFEICQEVAAFTPLTLSGFTSSNYIWKINGDSSNIIGQGTNTIQFPLSTEGTFKVEVLEITEFGCEGVVIDSNLIVHPKPRTSPIQGAAVICYPNYLNRSYSVTGFVTSTFNWFVEGGMEIPSPSSISSTTIDWSGQQLNNIKVLETSDFGCLGDTQSLDVFADRPSIKFDVVTVNPPPGSDKSMQIYWTLRNAPRYNSKFVVQKRPSGSTGPFMKVADVNFPISSHNETPLNTDNSAFEYRVIGYDLCDQEIVSDSHVNILLQGNKIAPYEVNMNFSSYQGWSSGVSEYQLYRYLPGKTGWQYMRSFSEAQANIDLANGLDYYTQCYRVKAIKAGINSADTISWSNEVCFDFDPVVWIPNGFTVNGDGLNDNFRITTGSLKSVEISVFNRWGELLFRTNDASKPWDGTYQGKLCPLDVYMYMVKFTGFDDKLYTQSGTLHLIR